MLVHNTHSGYLLHLIEYNSCSYLVSNRFLQCIFDVQLSLAGSYKLLVDCCVIDVFSKMCVSTYLLSLQMMSSIEILIYFGFSYISSGIGFVPCTHTSWISREIYDWFGLVYLNNYDLRRLYSDYFSVGYALRKSYPVAGSYEIRYDILACSMVYESISGINARISKTNRSW
jgi:hypothetical protein